MRRLSPEEDNLWARVAGTVRPVNGPVNKRSVAANPLTKRVNTLPSPIIASTNISASAPVYPSAPKTLAQNTLDATWDKRLRNGQASPDFTIDLHGETLSSAHLRLNRSLAAAVRDGARLILLITGRPAKDNPRLPPTSRGVIRASVKDWLAASAYTGHIAAIRGAHPRHGGAGALYLILKRAR